MSKSLSSAEFKLTCFEISHVSRLAFISLKLLFYFPFYFRYLLQFSLVSLPRKREKIPLPLKCSILMSKQNHGNRFCPWHDSFMQLNAFVLKL